MWLGGASGSGAVVYRKSHAFIYGAMFIPPKSVSCSHSGLTCLQYGMEDIGYARSMSIDRAEE